MALPPGVKLVTVNVGPFVDFQGNPVAGRTTFSPSTSVLHAETGTPVLNRPVVVELDPAGMGVVSLPATDDTALTPTGFVYYVQHTFTTAGVATPALATIALPQGAPVVDLDLLVPVTGASGLVVSLPSVVSVAGKSGVVTLTAADVSGTFGDNQIPSSIARDTEVGALAAASTEVRAAYGSDSDVYDGYATKGTTALAVADSGQTWGKVANATAGAGLSIVGGRLTNTATASGSAAGYGVIDLGSPLTRIGAEFQFAAAGTTNGGVIALIPWRQNIVTTYPTVPDTGFHLTVGPNDAALSYWQSQTPTFIKTWTFVDSAGVATPLLTDGATTYKVEVFIDGSTAYLLLPALTKVNGLLTRYVTITDQKITDLAGQFGCAEIYQNNAANDHRPLFVNVWMEAA